MVVVCEGDKNFSRARNGIVGVVLAGGKSSRMGTEKSFVSLAGAPLIDRVARRLQAQVAHAAINANGDSSRFHRLSLTVLADATINVGPLAGVLAGLRWANQHAHATHLLTVPCDGPFFPLNLGARLLDAMLAEGTDIAIARSRARSHPTFALYAISIVNDLAGWIAQSNDRSVSRWMSHFRTANVDFEGDPDPFTNINTPDDLATALFTLKAV